MAGLRTTKFFVVDPLNFLFLGSSVEYTFAVAMVSIILVDASGFIWVQIIVRGMGA